MDNHAEKKLSDSVDFSFPTSLGETVLTAELYNKGVAFEDSFSTIWHFFTSSVGKKIEVLSFGVDAENRSANFQKCDFRGYMNSFQYLNTK